VGSSAPTGWPNSGQASLRHSHSWSGPPSASLAGCPHVGHRGGELTRLVVPLAPAARFGDALLVSELDVDAGSDRLAALRASARGWHGVQLAVIGFIGLCGVLQGGRPDNPMWLQVFAGVLALAALALACVATVLVALVAWPLYGGRGPADDAAALERDGRRLKRGLVLTFAALAVLALGTASGWWPQDDGGGNLVAVEAANGERWCGTLSDAGPGSVGVSVGGGPVVVSLDDVVAVGPVDSC
jgi:hypothetical protein